MVGAYEADLVDKGYFVLLMR